jgi:hypothetical protein
MNSLRSAINLTVNLAFPQEARNISQRMRRTMHTQLIEESQKRLLNVAEFFASRFMTPPIRPE